MTTHRVVVVVPAFNEERNLPLLLEELAGCCSGYAVVVVDDGSRDGTARVAREHGVATIRHPVNRGYGAALKSGYRYALEHGYESVVLCDGDGQHDPREIERLMTELICSDADVVIGSRNLTTEGYRSTLVRSIGIRFFGALGEALTGETITDATSGFMAMRVRAAAYLAARAPDGSPDLQVRLMLLRDGFVVREVGTPMRRRRFGRSMNGGLAALAYLPKMLVAVGREWLVDPGWRKLNVLRMTREEADRRRVLIVNPPTGLYVREDRCQSPVKGVSGALRFPVDLAYMGASARENGAAVRIRDYPAEGRSLGGLRADLRRFRPHVLVISTISPTLAWDLEVCRVAKELLPDVLTVVKGSHVTVRASEVLESTSSLDVVIRGDFEVAAGEIAGGRPLGEIAGLMYRDAAGRIVETVPRPHLATPDELPFPARDLVRNELYVRPDTMRPQTTIQTSWGCPFECVYCLAPITSGRKLRSRSPASVVAEVRRCREEHGIRDFYFRADTFTLDRAWCLELCRLLEASRLDIAWGCNSRVDTVDAALLSTMRRAGCWIIGFGVESGSDEILRRIRKGTSVAQAREAVRLSRAAGIKAYTFFMIGLPWETEKTAQETMDLIRTIGAEFIEMSAPVPFPGTRLAELAQREGLIEAPLLGHDHSRPMIRPYAMSRERVAEYLRKGYFGFYGRPSHVAHLLSTAPSPVAAAGYLWWGARFFWRIASRARSSDPEAEALWKSARGPLAPRSAP